MQSAPIPLKLVKNHKEKLRPQVLARVSSFTDLTWVVQAGHAAAVLPEMAAVDFDAKKFKWEKISINS